MTNSPASKSQQLSNFNDTIQSFKSNSNLPVDEEKSDGKKYCNSSKKSPSMTSIIKASGFSNGKGAMQKELDAHPDAKFFVCREQEYKPDKYTRTYRGFGSVDDFMEFQRGIDKKDRMFHEMLTGEIIEAYDIDGSYSLPNFQDDDGNPLPDQDIIDNFLQAREDFGYYNKYNNYEFEESDVYIKTTSDPEKNKASFHIIIRNGYKFKSHVEAKKYMKEFNTYITENNLKVSIDNSLYSKNKTLRMLHSHKSGQPNRIAERYQDFNKGTTMGEAKLFCVSYLEGNEEFTCIDGDDGSSVEEKSNIVMDVVPMVDGEVNRLVDMICGMIDEGKHSLCKVNVHTNKLCYTDWWKLKTTMINCSDEYNARSLFKKLYPLYRHNEEIDLETKFESSLQDKGKYDKLTINTLRYYAKENPKYKELFPEHIKCNEVNKSLYMYNRMVNKRNKRVLTFDEDYNDIYNLKDLTKEQLLLQDYKAILKRVISNVSNGTNPILKILNTEYDEVSKKDIIKWETTNYKKITQSGGHLNKIVHCINPNYIKEFNEYNKLITTDPTLVDELDVPVMTTESFLGDEHSKGIFKDMFMNGEVTTYDKLVFKPYLHPGDVHVRQQDFNGYQPFPFYDSLAQEEEEISPEFYESSLFRKHMRNTLCGGDERVFNYVEKYIAHMIQKPYERADVGLVFTGAQGVGKDMFGNCLNNLIGKDKSLILGCMEDLFKNFNKDQEGVLLTTLNEISDKGIHINKHDQLKHLITRKYVKIEMKGLESYLYPHLSRYLCFSNKENILKVEASERRFLMIKTDNSVANDHAYFKPLWEQIENVDFLKSMMKYYSTLDISNFVVRDLPETTYKEEQKILNLSNPLSFVLDMCKDELEHNVKWDEEENAKIHTQDLYKMFELWCSNGGTIKNNKKNFISELKSLGLVEHNTKFSIKGIMGKHIIRFGFHLNKSSLETFFKKYMKNDNFSFSQ